MKREYEVQLDTVGVGLLAQAFRSHVLVKLLQKSVYSKFSPKGNYLNIFIIVPLTRGIQDTPCMLCTTMPEVTTV